MNVRRGCESLAEEEAPTSPHRSSRLLKAWGSRYGYVVIESERSKVCNRLLSFCQFRTISCANNAIKNQMGIIRTRINHFQRSQRQMVAAISHERFQPACRSNL